MQIGYTHGRFQPLHNGHFLSFLRILEDYGQLWIGISNPLRNLPIGFENFPTELKESLGRARAPENNPYSYKIRQEMILNSFIQKGIDLKLIRVMPHYGFYEEERWKDFIPCPEHATVVLSVKDYHHYQKVEQYKSAGWDVKFLKAIPNISGEIFDSEWPCGNWRELVPKGAIPYLETRIAIND